MGNMAGEKQTSMVRFMIYKQAAKLSKLQQKISFAFYGL